MNKSLAQSNKSPHRANATKKRNSQPQGAKMKSLILAACIFVCTVGIANAQRESGNYMGGFFGTNIIGSIPKREICTWSIADKVWCPQPQSQRKPRNQER
jgi:hypothetical protein